MNHSTPGLKAMQEQMGGKKEHESLRGYIAMSTEINVSFQALTTTVNLAINLLKATLLALSFALEKMECMLSMNTID